MESITLFYQIEQLKMRMANVYTLAGKSQPQSPQPKIHQMHRVSAGLQVNFKSIKLQAKKSSVINRVASHRRIKVVSINQLKRNSNFIMNSLRKSLYKLRTQLRDSKSTFGVFYFNRQAKNPPSEKLNIAGPSNKKKPPFENDLISRKLNSEYDWRFEEVGPWRSMNQL